MQTAFQQTRSLSHHDSLAIKLNTQVQSASFFLPMLRQRAKDFGVPRLAQALNKTPKVLNNELNPNSPEHKLGFETAIHLCALMEDISVLQLWAQSSGLVVFEPPQQKLVDDQELLSCMSCFTKEVGDVAGAIHEALDDFRITSHEVLTIRNEMNEAVASMFQLLHRISELQEPSGDDHDNSNRFAK
jgi:hypothetical protein